jgi:hypothetical protein
VQMSDRCRSLKLAVFSAFLLSPLFSYSAETDQFTLPDQPLDDLGSTLDIEIRKGITRAITGLRERLHFFLEEDIYNALTENAKEKILGRFERKDSLAAQTYHEIGGHGLFFTGIELRFESESFDVEHPRFHPGFQNSIYKWWPVYAATLSSTVNLFGHHLGTDKIGHFFQQGYGYYQIARIHEANGWNPTDVNKKAIEHGLYQEDTYFGRFLTAPASRADLAANYAGYQFYRNLTEAIDIPGAEEPIVTKLYFSKHGRDFFVWKLNSKREKIIEPFFSDHFNEALNPSSFNERLTQLFEPEVIDRCEDWKKEHPDWTHESVTEIHNSLKTWHGIDYGHPGNFDGALVLGDLCWEASAESNPEYESPESPPSNNMERPDNAELPPLYAPE